MKKLLLAFIFVISAMALPVLADEQIAEVSVTHVQAMVTAKPTKVVVLDANNEQARVEAGYKDVRVMKAGIVGWNAANKKAS